MPFSFDPSLSSDVSLVRFHIGDTNVDGHYLEDATINYFLKNYDLATAVLRCIQYIITQLSTPNFRVDFLTVSNEQARAGYEALLQQKAAEFGVSYAGISAETYTITLGINQS